METKKLREIKRELMDSLMESSYEYGLLVLIYSEEIKKAKTIKDIMEAKVTFLSNIVSNTLPVTATDCPYCLKYEQECEECEYGKVHGICTKRSSSYAKIKAKILQLSLAIRELYFKKEKMKD
jgi:hypothetical protein